MAFGITALALLHFSADGAVAPLAIAVPVNENDAPPSPAEF